MRSASGGSNGGSRRKSRPKRPSRKKERGTASRPRGASSPWLGAVGAAGASSSTGTPPGSLAPVPVRRHERIAVVGRRDERLLDRPRAHPADQVPHRARLVVRPGGTRAAEGLLRDDRARRLVVDVEVPGRVAKDVRGL